MNPRSVIRKLLCLLGFHEPRAHPLVGVNVRFRYRIVCAYCGREATAR